MRQARMQACSWSASRRTGENWASARCVPKSRGRQPQRPLRPSRTPRRRTRLVRSHPPADSVVVDRDVGPTDCGIELTPPVIRPRRREERPVAGARRRSPSAPACRDPSRAPVREMGGARPKEPATRERWSPSDALVQRAAERVEVARGCCRGSSDQLGGQIVRASENAPRSGERRLRSSFGETESVNNASPRERIMFADVMSRWTTPAS